jgi:hypothetical protein
MYLNTLIKDINRLYLELDGKWVIDPSMRSVEIQELTGGGILHLNPRLLQE